MKKNRPLYLLFVLPSLLLGVSGCQNNSQQEKKASNENGSMSYEVFVRSFYDTNGDQIGDLNGVKAKLPYFADLGIKTLCIHYFLFKLCH